MSSTDRAGGAKSEPRLRQFFAEHIVPAAERLRRRGVRFFATARDSAVTSYFQKCEPRSESLFMEIEPRDCQTMLVARWQREGLPELVDLSGPLFALAQELAPVEEAADDVSPFIYVMF